MKILLVDDDELLRAVLTELLTRAGYEIVSTADPHEALGLPDAVGPPNVVITDIDLDSTLNGFDVSTAAHRQWPTIQVILISGLSVSHTGQALDQRDRYIQKPFSSTRLLRVIEESTNAARRGQPVYGRLQTATEPLGLVDVFRQTIAALVRLQGPDLTLRQLGVFLVCYMGDEAATVRGLADKLNLSRPVISLVLDRLLVFDLVRLGKRLPGRQGVLVQRTITGAALVSDLKKNLVEAGRVANLISSAYADISVESV